MPHTYSPVRRGWQVCTALATNLASGCALRKYLVSTHTLTRKQLPELYWYIHQPRQTALWVCSQIHNQYLVGTTVLGSGRVGSEPTVNSACCSCAVLQHHASSQSPTAQQICYAAGLCDGAPSLAGPLGVIVMSVSVSSIMMSLLRQCDSMMFTVRGH